MNLLLQRRGVSHKPGSPCKCLWKSDFFLNSLFPPEEELHEEKGMEIAFLATLPFLVLYQKKMGKKKKNI